MHIFNIIFSFLLKHVYIIEYKWKEIFLAPFIFGDLLNIT